MAATALAMVTASPAILAPMRMRVILLAPSALPAPMRRMAVLEIATLAPEAILLILYVFPIYLVQR